ncbi:MAG: NAD(P)/FAD-dependent oxidoreductase [Actinomycetota bacterium]|nr:NAD(P)/FAD-dependent oxidoreductase [Actinomycetota bacterium]
MADSRVAGRDASGPPARTRADLLVAGAGPVGLAVAIEAASAGLDVVVADPRAGGSRDKACGEGLMPSTVAALRRLGVDPPGVPIVGIRYVGADRVAEALFSSGAGRGVRRTVLVDALEARARSLGVDIVARAVAGVGQLDGEVQAAGVRARYLAVADGLHSPLRRELGLNSTATAFRGRRVGLRRHFRVAPWSSHVEVHWSADAEAYVTPVSADTVGVAILCRGGAPYDVWLDAFPELRERLRSAQPVTAVRGAGPLRQRSRRRVHGRAMLVGDAAGYVDALTGEGIAVGLAGAQALVRCVTSNRASAYEAAWRRSSLRARLLTAALLWASQQPAARRRLVCSAAACPPAFRAAVNLLA